MDKIIGRTSRWEVRIKGNDIVVDLFEPIYTEKEVLKILDAYQKALYDRLNKELGGHTHSLGLLTNLIKFKPRG